MRLLERDRELDVLAQAMVRAAHGPGMGVAVSGEPGVGKTSLVAAARERVPAVRFLRGGCDPLATPRPLGPFRDLFADLGSLDPDAAHRLFISPKTTDHHVSAVLLKLGMPNRRAVVVQADQLGLA